MSIEKNRPSRRDFLAGAAALTGAAALGGNAEAADKKFPDALQDFFDAAANPHEYSMGSLEGHKLGDPLSVFVGVEGEVSAKEKIDFRHQLGLLWKRKFDRKDKTGRTLLDNSSPATLDGVSDLLNSYDPQNAVKCTITDHRTMIGKAITEARSSIDLNSITDIYQFSDYEESQTALLKALEKKISPTMLLAYSLTEIMPTTGAQCEIGVQALNFLLQKAGSDFVDRIPALYDTMLSLGPYQFTSNALFEVGHTRQGASVINGLAKSPQIPGSVIKLRGLQHHKAAYCFAVYNLAYAIDEMDADHCEKLLKPPLSDALDAKLVTEYVASAHHLPANARKSLISFTDQIIRAHDHPDKKIRHDPYIGHADAQGLSDYVNKTSGNLRALKKQYGWTLE
jgi:hypothetical protein